MKKRKNTNKIHEEKKKTQIKIDEAKKSIKKIHEENKIKNR